MHQQRSSLWVDGAGCDGGVRGLRVIMSNSIEDLTFSPQLATSAHHAIRIGELHPFSKISVSNIHCICIFNLT